ncbi:hypothetical protein [Geminocystis sp. GBBB08]|uniref:hypothetical protein n=1 Tax=Geminocystis sp. GBBB08 TaxID=2604140 RepID=UPI0027E3065A|nr:hypothetical protein [Geminocystis sp. GBBB08]MBL1211005.1 hypothetical protein [Geminocystis sp. GBBB08]
MTKISTVVSPSTINSPNLELSSSKKTVNPAMKKKIVSKKRDINNTPKQKEKNSLSIFKKLIILTTIIFSFGGLGFGLALRFGQNLDIYQSTNSPISNRSF